MGFMKRIFVKQLLAIFFFLSGTTFAAKLSVSLESEAAILINADTGAILYEKNAHTPHYPASTTKIVTTAYALKEKGNQLTAIVAADQESIASISEEAKKRSNYTTPSHWIEHASTHMGIKKGEEFTFKDLLLGVMVVSANDASNVVAQYVSGSVPNFVKNMNSYVKSLGCQESHFMNPHGLHHPKHQTTAYDLAMITREAMKDPTFCEIVKTIRFIRPKTNKQEPTVMLQKNRLLRPGRFYYPKAIGVKTGYTSIARHNLVAAAKHEDRTLIAVMMKCDESSQVFRDAIKLFDAAFNEVKVQKVMLKEGSQKFEYEIAGADKPVKTYSSANLAYEYYPAEEPVVKCYLQWHKVSLPIKKGQQVGEVQLKTTENKLIQLVPLFAAEDVNETWLHWLKNLF